MSANKAVFTYISVVPYLAVIIHFCAFVNNSIARYSTINRTKRTYFNFITYYYTAA